MKIIYICLNKCYLLSGVGDMFRRCWGYSPPIPIPGVSQGALPGKKNKEKKSCLMIV